MPQQQLSVITHSIIVSRILYALPAWGGFLSVEFKIESMPFSSARRFGYMNCNMTIDDLSDRSYYELFTKVCSARHSLYHLLPPYRKEICVCVVILFSCLIFILMCIKSRPLFDFCMNILNKIVGWYLVVLFFCVFIAFMFSVCSIATVLMCVCCILIKITYLLNFAKRGGRQITQRR